MKTFIYILGLLLSLIAFSCDNGDDIYDATKVQELLDLGKSPKSLYNGGIPIDSLYGKVYQEGIIFHFVPDDGTGLVLSLNDLSTEAIWGCRGKDISGLDNAITFPLTMLDEETEAGALIGDGFTNTNLIIDICKEENMAASICKKHGSDWFLPSRGEFRLISINLNHQRVEGLLPNTMYWTSTEFDNNNAWKVSFGWGASTAYKDDKSYVRAIKKF